jgi:hypothetical protein
MLLALGTEILDAKARIGSVTVAWSPSEATGAAHALVAEALARL